MDLEKLTTHQIVLLTLLVSFVTSIATGIVTVTLVAQAPPALTNTINRVVERTVERVVPDTKSQSASVITKETTVIVKEEDLITAAIKKGSNNLARIQVLNQPDPDTNEYKTIVIGTIISANGFIITDPSYIVDGGVYTMIHGDSRYDLEVLSQDEDLGIALLMVTPKEGEDVSFKAIPFADMSDLKLGQTIISIGGNDRDRVSMGVISSIENTTIEIPPETAPVEGEEPQIQTKDVVYRVDSTTYTESLSGTPNFNVFGEMIGMTIKSSDSHIIPASSIISFVQKFKESQSKEPEKT